MTMIITRTITICSSSTIQTMIPASAPASITHLLYHRSVASATELQVSDAQMTQLP